MNEKKEKWLDEQIYRTIDPGKPRFDPEKWKQKHPEEFQILISRAKADSATQTNIWRIITKSSITKFAAAAVIVIAVGITIAIFNSSKSADRQIADSNIKQQKDQSDGLTENLTAVNTIGTSPKLEAELRQVEQMFAVGDVDGLSKILSDGEYEAKVAAANHLAKIGNLSNIPVLEQLNNEYGSNEPAFAYAIAAIEEQVTNNQIQDTNAADEQAATLVTSGVNAEQTGDELFRLVPEASLFCVRVNNFDSAFGTLDQFLAGASPVPAGTTMFARMQLAGALGDPALNNINTTGNFVIFGVSMPDKETNESMESLFVGCLAPVTDYAKFVSDNANCDNPDSNGVSIIKCGGTVNPDKKTLVTQVGGYALISSSSSYDKLVSVAKSISAGNTGLGSTLDANDVKAATKEPVWAYVNIQRASNVFGPVVTAKLEQMKKQIEKLNASKQGGPPPEVMNMYFGMLDILMKEIDSVSITIRPQTQVCNLIMDIQAVPQTYMARMFTSDESSRTENDLLGYLQDGAICNVAVKMNTPFLEELILSNYDLLFFIDEGNDISDGTTEKLEKLIADMIASSNGPGVITFGYDEENKSPFVGRYVVAVKDAEKWAKVQEGIMEIWNTSGFAKTYRKLGMETNYEIKHGTDTYRDVSIDSARFSMNAIDPNSDYGKAINQIYNGIDYRWATVDGLYAMVVGSDCNSAIYDLIDQIKAGGPQEMSTEMQQALSILNEAKESEFVGTFNYIRMLKMAAAMTPEDTNGFMAPPGGIPKIDVPTNSNLAFAGKVGNGRMTMEIALPKEHMLELKAAGEAMQKAMLEANVQTGAVKAVSTALKDSNDSNVPVDYNLLTDTNFASDQESAIAGLKDFAEITDGKYPSQMNLEIAIEEAAQAWKEKSGPNYQEPNEEDLKKILSIGSTYSFFLKQSMNCKEVVYHGDVTTEFGNAVLMRWKIDDVNFGVIYGDLTVEDVTAAELEELESRPYINTSAYSVNPNPADGAIVSMKGISGLSWTPAADAIRHRVYFGTDINDLMLISETATPSFSQLPAFQADTTYYWSIDEIHTDGSVGNGKVWSFNTGGKLISLWKLDETYGTIAADSSGNGNNGTLTNMAGDEWTDGVVDGALDFDGTDDYIKVDDSDSLDMGNTFTVALWVNYEGGDTPDNYERMLTKKAAWDSLNGWEISLETNYDTEITVRGSSGDGYPPNGADAIVSSWATGGWHHIVVVYKGTNVTVYSDGVQRDTVTIAPVVDNNLPLYIGRYGDLEIHHWDGIIDDVRIYNYALSTDEIVDIYVTGAVNLQQ